MGIIKCILFLLIVCTIPICRENISKDCSNFYKMLNRQQIHLDPDDDDDAWYGFPFFSSGIREDSSFSNIYYNPEFYLSCYAHILNDNELDKRYKHIALLSMQNVKTETYLEVMKLTFNAYKSKKISHYTLSTLIDQDCEWNNTVVSAVNNPKMKSILLEIKVYGGTPEYIQKKIDRLIG